MNAGRTLLLASCLLLLLASTAGCRRNDDVVRTEDGQLVVGEAVEREVVERGIDPAQRTLSFRGFNGTIALRGTAEPVARLTFDKQARASGPEAARDLLRQTRITESGGDREYRYVVHAAEPAQTTVDVRGTVPAGTALRIEMLRGTVLLSGVTGPLRIEVTSGRVVITGAGSDVDVELRNGGIDVGLQALPAGTRVRLETRNGDVALALPPAASVDVEAQTQAGAIRADTPMPFEPRTLTLQGAGATFEGRLGTGAAEATLATRNGSVTLRTFAPPAPLALPDTARTLAPTDSLPAPVEGR